MIRFIKRYHPRMDYNKVNKERMPFRVLGVFFLAIAIFELKFRLFLPKISPFLVWLPMSIGSFYWDIIALIQTMSEGYRLSDEGICFWHKFKKHKVDFREIHVICIVNKSIHNGDITGIPFLWLIGGKETGVVQYCMQDRNKNCRLIDTEIAQILVENHETENNYGFAWNSKEIHKFFKGYQGEYYVAESLIRDFPNEYDTICEKYDIKQRVHIIRDLP